MPKINKPVKLTGAIILLIVIASTGSSLSKATEGKPANLFVNFGLVVCFVVLFYFIYKTWKSDGKKN